MKTLQLFVIFLFLFCEVFSQNIFTSKFGFAVNNMEVSSMPEYFRNVPIHPDDGGGPNSGTIGKTSYHNWLVIPTFGVEFSHRFKDRISVGVGVNFEFSWADRAEVNYNSSGSPQRGTGTALTYCGTLSRGMCSLLSYTQTDDPDVIPTTYNISLTPNIFITFPITKKVDIKFNVTYQRYACVNGWDRYNTLEINQKKTLAYIVPIDILFSFKYVEFGPRIPISWRTDAGKEFGTKIFSFGFVVNYRLGTDN